MYLIQMAPQDMNLGLSLGMDSQETWSLGRSLFFAIVLMRLGALLQKPIGTYNPAYFMIFVVKYSAACSQPRSKRQSNYGCPGGRGNSAHKYSKAIDQRHDVRIWR